MKKSTKLRLFGGTVILFNLWLIGQYNLSRQSRNQTGNTMVAEAIAG